MRTFRILAVLSLCGALGSGFAAEPSRNGKVILARRVMQAVELDGKLDEDDWKQAQSATDFVQQDPNEGQPILEPTEVRVLYDDRNLYIGFECWDAQPNRIVANEMRRDGNIWQNDNVYVMLDTYGDRRQNFFFRTNALGAQEDAAVTGDGSNINGNWDGIWESVGRRHDKGWTVEMAIPFNQLRFKEKPTMEWGVNFGRNILHHNSSAQWHPVPRTESWPGTYRPTYAGRLVGLEGIRSSAHLEIAPYVLAGVSEQLEDGVWDKTFERNIGLDVKYGLTPNLTLDLTTNTDFAQVESDREEVNLSRFDLYFPEKRDFFLEGGGLFDFTAGGGENEPPGFNLFYSRRIGVEDGDQAKILGGGKLSGKVGAYSVGLLNLMTDAVSDVPQTDFSVLRVQRDILSRSSAGFILTNRQFGLGGDYRRNAGADLNLRLQDQWRVNALVAGSFAPDASQRDAAFYLSNNWRNDHLSVDASYLDIGRDFNAETGFVQRTDIRSFGFGIQGEDRFESQRYPMPRAIDLEANGRYLLDHDNQLLGWDAWLSHRTEFRDFGYWVGVNRNYDRVDEAFEIEGATIPAGAYETNRARTEIWTSVNYPISGFSYGGYGEFFNGTRFEMGVNPQWRVTYQISLEGRYNYNRVKLPDAEFSTNILGLRVNYSMNTRFFTRLFTQWNDTTDRVSTNFLLRYIYRPGSDFYVVYDQAWKSSEGKRATEAWTLVTKFTYLVNY